MGTSAAATDKNKAAQPGTSYLSTLILSILAGMSIGIGGCLFLAIENKVVGSLFFTLGLFTICTRGFYLFTGKVGYVFDNPPSYIIDLVIIWVGNLIGTNIDSFLISLTRIGAAFTEKAAGISGTKLNDGILSVFVLGIFCNILMYIAVDGFKKNPHDFGKYVGLFLCVAGFILAGFEHCVANMYYIPAGLLALGVPEYASLAAQAGLDTAGLTWAAFFLKNLLPVTLGNLLGGCGFAALMWAAHRPRG